jgi:hypothetical protein
MNPLVAGPGRKTAIVVCVLTVFGAQWQSANTGANAGSSKVDAIPITANAAATALIRKGLDAADDDEDPSHYFAAAHAADPSSVTARFLAATVLPAANKKNAAMDAALALPGELPETERLALRFVAARFRFDVAEQTRIADLLVRRVPGSAIAHGFRAEALQLSGDELGAEMEYRRMLTIDPSKAAADGCPNRSAHLCQARQRRRGRRYRPCPTRTGTWRFGGGRSGS